MEIGIAGLGAIGATVARTLDRGEVDGCSLKAIAARSNERADAFRNTLRTPVPNMSFEELATECDCVIECLPPALFDDIALPVLRLGKKLIAMSASQLLGRQDLVDLAQRTGARIFIPSGAMLGLDALKAVAVGRIQSVTIQTRKPPDSLAKAPFFQGTEINIAELTEPVRVLSGTVSQVAEQFPANVNVAAALSLAGIGPEQTRMEIWADPTIDYNTHTVRVESDSSDFTMTISNRPSDENPATGRITSQSVIALLRGFRSPISIGT